MGPAEWLERTYDETPRWGNLVSTSRMRPILEELPDHLETLRCPGCTRGNQAWPGAMRWTPDLPDEIN